MRIKHLFFLLIISTAIIFGQLHPDSYELSGKGGSKVQADNPVSNGISDIVTYNDYVFLGTSRGVSISTDRGISWTNYYEHPAFGTESISAIGFDTITNTFWAATAHNVERDGASLPEGSGLRYTTDFGANWTTIPQPIDAPNDTIEIYGVNEIRALPVTVSIQNIIYDIAFTPNAVWIASFAAGLRKSTDMGATWDRVVIPPDRLDAIYPDSTYNFCLTPVAGQFCADNNLNHRVFSVASAGDSTVYVGSAGGINKSTDAGLSWRKFSHQNQQNSISGNFVVALGFNPADSSIWGATWKAEAQDEFYGVSTSSDGGDNWSISLVNERVHNFGFKNTDVIAPADNGAFRSSDMGSIWLLPGEITDDETGIVLSTQFFYAASSEGNVIWLGSGDGLVKLTEAGMMWKGNWKIYIASQKFSSADDTYAFPNPFSPGLETMKIKYSTGGKRTDVTIRIFDFAMNYIRTIIQNAPRGNPVHVIGEMDLDTEGVIDYWDGRDDAGSIVPNGVYFYRIETGENDPVFGKILVLR